MMQDQRYPGWEYQQLFNHMSEEHDLILTQSQMDKIISICAETIVILDEKDTPFAIEDSEGQIMIIPNSK